MLVSLADAQHREGGQTQGWLSCEKRPLFLPIEGYAAAQQLHQAAVDLAPAVKQLPRQLGIQERQGQDCLDIA